MGGETSNWAEILKVYQGLVYPTLEQLDCVLELIKVEPVVGPRCIGCNIK